MAFALAQKSKRPSPLQAKRGRAQKQSARLDHVEQDYGACTVGFGKPSPVSTAVPMIQAQTHEEEKEMLQGKFTPSEISPRLQGNGDEADNRTGMPGALKAGLEVFSGMDLSGIRVHHNSAKPAQLNAAAYTQGQNIYIGPGQEKHLSHEGWHVVQQMQGRVIPTMQVKGVLINDDTNLEREADVMGAVASQRRGLEQTKASDLRRGQLPVHEPITQRSIAGFSATGCNFDVFIDIGLYAKPSLYNHNTGLSDPSKLETLARRWQADINTLWTGSVPCHDSTNQCRFTMHATIRAHPEANFRFQVPETNSVRVREGKTDFRSMAFGRWGAWAHDEDDLTIAHETGHLLGLADKYFYISAMKSYPKFVQDIMANYPRDSGPPEFGPARARIMALKSQRCPCCTEGGMRRKP